MRHLLLPALLSACAALAQADFYLQQGDRIEFCGSGKPGSSVDTHFIETYVATRFALRQITFNDGDVSHQPNVIVLLPAQGCEVDLNAAQALPGASSGPRIAAVQFGEQGRPGGLGKAQLFTLHVNETRIRHDLAAAVHLLRAWNAPPTVTSVDIDIPSRRVIDENTTVRDLETGRVVAWTQDDRAIPLPPQVASELTVAPELMRAIDLQQLRVTRLTEPAYDLTIDGERIGKFSREQLEAGLNLTLFATPMTKQAARVHSLAQGSKEADSAEQLRSALQPGTHDYELQPVTSQ